ncbi:hypothetical protein SKAU_G00023440 [Synaphobranchus kaupii]|uniref:Uncharacterized protein n=1 Tax=Synaphobranchus kaupii TaxID=118154 RepID=A0A9Q1JCF6_SYNKA|nr:hypothetical protein SKAU_G00023440 [Synaphobranchus kaupii]
MSLIAMAVPLPHLPADTTVTYVHYQRPFRPYLPAQWTPCSPRLLPQSGHCLLTPSSGAPIIVITRLEALETEAHIMLEFLSECSRSKDTEIYGEQGERDSGWEMNQPHKGEQREVGAEVTCAAEIRSPSFRCDGQGSDGLP